MLESDRLETENTAVTLIRHRNEIEKSTWRTHRYFIDFATRLHVEISTSNRCHNFHVDSLFKIDEISTNFLCGISTSNRWQIDEDVSIGVALVVVAAATAGSLSHLKSNFISQLIKSKSSDLQKLLK